MTLRITDTEMTSDLTGVRADFRRHGAVDGQGGWILTGLSGRLFTRDQALAIMQASEQDLTGPGLHNPDMGQARTCDVCGGRGWLRMPGSEEFECNGCHGHGWVPMATPSCPRCGADASAIRWAGGDGLDARQPVDTWRCGDCGHEWQTSLRQGGEP